MALRGGGEGGWGGWGGGKVEKWCQNMYIFEMYERLRDDNTCIIKISL